MYPLSSFLQASYPASVSSLCFPIWNFYLATDYGLDSLGHWQCLILGVRKFWSKPWLLEMLIELDQVFVLLWHYKTSVSLPNIWTSLEVIWYDHVLISETFSSDSNLSMTVLKKVIDYPIGQQMPLGRATWRNWGHSVIVEHFSKIIITQVFSKYSDD